jgi:NADPH:quinone reductase-like Zn-dependent oxidoreductase
MYLPLVARITAPFGVVCSIVQGQVRMHDTEFMAKSLTFVWELLSTGSRYGVPMDHAKVLTDLAALIDEGKIVTHLTRRIKLTVQGLREAHAFVESGKSIGKVGLSVDEEGEGEAFA